jgi:hypothetical protein
MIYSLARLGLGSFTISLALGLGRISLCKMWKPISNLAVACSRTEYRRDRNQFHLYSLFSSLPNSVLHDAIPFTVSLPLIRISGSISEP